MKSNLELIAATDRYVDFSPLTVKEGTRGDSRMKERLCLTSDRPLFKMLVTNSLPLPDFRMMMIKLLRQRPCVIRYSSCSGKMRTGSMPSVMCQSGLSTSYPKRL